MHKSLFIFFNLFVVTRAFALVGTDELSKNLYQKNQEILSLEKNVESKEALSRSSTSVYYPTLNAVGGWGQNKTDDLATTQKGYFGYAEGKLNLFRGFKDQSISDQKEIDLKISQLDLESKKRELRLELIEVSSDMILLHKFQSILDEEYKITQTQKQMAAKKVAAGLTGPVDNLEFDLRENEIQIEQKQINQKHLEAHQKFVKLYGEDVSDSVIEKIDFSQFENLVQPSIQFNAENSLDFQKAKLNENRAQLERKEAKSDYLPTLDFTYSVGRITPSEVTPAQFNESKYAVQLTIPLFSGFETYYKSKSAFSNESALEKMKHQKRNDVESEFNVLKTKMTELSSLFQINEKKLSSSQKYFDLTLAEYRRGVKNSPDLVSATERLFSAKKKKYEILKELEISKVKIENLN
jgi:outer membrane protein